MKKLQLLLTLLLLCHGGLLKAQKSTAVKAPKFSEWIKDKSHPWLKVRYMIKKASTGYNYVYLEIHTELYCRFKVSASVCGADGNKPDKNSWRTVKLYSGQSVSEYFPVHDSCNDGFWWWYKEFFDSERID